MTVLQVALLFAPEFDGSVERVELASLTFDARDLDANRPEFFSRIDDYAPPGRIYQRNTRAHHGARVLYNEKKGSIFVNFQCDCFHGVYGGNKKVGARGKH